MSAKQTEGLPFAAEQRGPRSSEGIPLLKYRQIIKESPSLFWNHPFVFFGGKPPKNPPPLIGEAEQNPPVTRLFLKA